MIITHPFLRRTRPPLALCALLQSLTNERFSVLHRALRLMPVLPSRRRTGLRFKNKLSGGSAKRQMHLNRPSRRTSAPQR